jgi:hypothetical protein
VLAFRGSLDHLGFALVGGGASPLGDKQDVPLTPGKLYELRCSATLYVRPGGGGAPTTTNLQVRPDSPLVFRARQASMTIAAGTADCYAWLRESDDDEGDDVDVNGAAKNGCAL